MRTSRMGNGKSNAATEAATSAIWYSYLLMATWITLSATVILFNKYLLSYAGFAMPITLTMIHMLFCSTLTALLFHVGPFFGLRLEKGDMPAASCAAVLTLARQSSFVCVPIKQCLASQCA